MAHTRNHFWHAHAARIFSLGLLSIIASCGEGAIRDDDPTSYDAESIRRRCGDFICNSRESCLRCRWDCTCSPAPDAGVPMPDATPQLDAAPPPPDSSCVPTTCAAQGKNCGTISNGCGGTVACGGCTAPNTCGGGGTPNLCGQAKALFADDFEALPIGLWSPGTVHGGWSGVFSSSDSVGIGSDGSHVLTQSAKPAVPGTTYSTGVYTTASFGDLDLTTRLKTVAQLRTGSTPNPWEVGWIFWHYTDRLHFYWLILKPTGWELGKVQEGSGCPWGNQCQVFLRTGSSPGFPIGRWYTIRIRQVGSDISVWVDGTLLTTYSDTSGPYLTGTIGLYEEDAQVHFDDLRVSAP